MPISAGNLLRLSHRGQEKTCPDCNVQKHCLETHCRVSKASLLKKYLYIRVHNSPKVDTIQISIKRSAGTQMWYSSPVGWCSTLKGVACWHVLSWGRTWGYAEGNKPVTKGEKWLHFHTFLEEAKSCRQKVEWKLPGTSDEGNVEVMREEFFFRVFCCRWWQGSAPMWNVYLSRMLKYTGGFWAMCILIQLILISYL